MSYDKQYLDNKITTTKQGSMNPVDFNTQANNIQLEIQKGIIKELYVLNDSVFATIQKEDISVYSLDDELLEHGNSLFNSIGGLDPLKMTVPELTVLTDIDASNNQLKRYIGKTVRVTVKKGVAVLAEVEQGFNQLTTIPASLIRRARSYLSGVTDDIFSEQGKKFFKENGYTDEDIENLSKFKYVEEMAGKINTFEGEALWFKDTSAQTKDENIIPINDLLVGTNQLGMKSKKCHIPTKIFSGK